LAGVAATAVLLGLAACATAGSGNGAASLAAGADMRDGPGGEAGPISLRDQGFFWVGKRVSTAEGQNGPQTTIQGQMHVGYQLVAEKKHPYPLILVHGGGGQATDYMGAPDGRDGWLDYFLAAGFDVYFVDRPAHGRSPNNVNYGELRPPPATQFIANAFTIQSEQYPGTGEADDPMVIEHTASSEPGPTVSTAMLKENFAELLDRVGPAIIVTHSAGGPSGWLALDARPDMVKGILAIEAASGLSTNLQHNLTWSPALGADETLAQETRASEGEGLNACTRQPDAGARTLPAFQGKPILGVVSPNSFPMFTPNYHCTIEELNQLGANATLVRLDRDWGLEGNGHFMNEELNNGEIARRFIAWLSTIE
jgi:pimeloyl-ACP methyl ester carboxylesterase